MQLSGPRTLAHERNKPRPNSSKSTRRKSRQRSQDFLVNARTYCGLAANADAQASLEAEPHPKCSTVGDALPTPTGANDNPSTPTSSNDNLSPRSASNDNLPAPPRWDEADELLLAVLYQRAIAKLGGVSFSLNLGPEVENAARADPVGFTDHVRRRVARELKAAFGKTVEFWFGVDVTRAGRRPHLHGTVSVSAQDVAKLKRALARAGGEWGAEAGQRYQVHIGSRLDDAWGFYTTRAIIKKRRYELTPPGRKRPDPMLTATRDIRRAAKAMFQEERERLTSVRQARIARVPAAREGTPAAKTARFQSRLSALARVGSST